jgi:sugar lactone lactonase YvrE
VEDVNNVRIVHNQKPLWGNEPKVGLEFIQKWGKEDDPDDNYLLYNPWDICIDNNSNLYIVDSGNNRIQKYDSKGNYIKTIGRRGQGPGEFSSPPKGLNIDTNGNMYVILSTGRTILKLNPEEEEIDRITFPAGYTEFCLTSEGNIVKPNNPQSVRYLNDNPLNMPEKDIKLLKLFNNNGKLIREFGDFKDFEDINVYIFANLVQCEIDSENHIYVTFTRQNRIEKYSPDGLLLWRADRPLNYALTYNLEERKTPSTGGAVIKSYLPRFTGVSTGIGVDQTGLIWVQTIKKQKSDDNNNEYEFEVFNNDGVLLGKIPLPEELEGSRGWAMRMLNHRLYILGIKRMFVYEYEVIHK